MGSRNAAFYRVIVQDARRAPTGRFIETLGWYDPKQDGINFSLNIDRVDYWLGNGAQTSDTVKSLIKKARTLPAEQSVAGEVTEEEVPAAAIEADEAAIEATEETAEETAGKEDIPEEDAAAQKEAPAEEPAAEAVEKAPTEEPAAEAAAEPADEDADKEKA
jgi:small subunit ribosomal protein S16